MTQVCPAFSPVRRGTTINVEGIPLMVHAVRDEVTAAQVAALTPGLRRYAAARHVDPADIDDLVQETTARLLEVRTRLDLATLFAYALAVLTNLDRSNRRADEVARRHRHRLLALDGPTSADDEIIRVEQQDALRKALDSLAPEVRALLVDHYGSGTSKTTSTSGARAARLARARARLRLEYLLALRRITLPEPRCRSVLIAISERNTRRQTELDTGSHVARCPVCMPLVEPLLRRDARLFGLWPLLGLAAVIRRAAGSHPALAAGAGVATAGAVTAAVVLTLPSPHHRPATQPSALCRMTGAERGGMVGQQVTAERASVASVPANEGFFVRACDGNRVWVHLAGPGESRLHIRAHDHVTMTGVVRRVEREGLPDSLSAADARQLRRSGVLLVVPFTEVSVRRTPPSR
jgi:DNA-directed RNA polymerase specialized sigma24 family protein